MLHSSKGLFKMIQIIIIFSLSEIYTNISLQSDQSTDKCIYRILIQGNPKVNGGAPAQFRQAKMRVSPVKVKRPSIILQYVLPPPTNYFKAWKILMITVIKYVKQGRIIKKTGITVSFWIRF